MKKLIICLFFIILLPFNIYAQSNPNRIREIGLSFNNFNNFGIRYKTGSNKALLRLTLLSVRLSKNEFSLDSASGKNSTLGFGFDIGLEKRKQLREKLNLLYGADLISSVSLYRYTGNSNLDYEWGAGLVLGLQYIISNSFSLSAELVPSFIYEFSKNTTTANGYERKIKNNAYHIILNNNNTNLTLAYRLVK